MKQTSTSNRNITNIRQSIKEELSNNKLIKSSLILGAGVLGLFALGFVFKALNYTVDNFKNLNETFRR